LLDCPKNQHPLISLSETSYRLSLHPLTKILELAEHLRIRPDKETIKKWGGKKVKVKFTLNMENLTVDETHIDRLSISWTNDVTEEEVLSMSGQWISTQNFLTQRMIGLKKVGESSLTIEPIEEPSPN
jgi:hypothetical protein